MKKNISTVLSLALMTALSLGVSGCGSDAEDELTDAINEYSQGTGGTTNPTGNVSDLSGYGFVIIYKNVSEAYLSDLEESFAGYKDFTHETVSNTTTCGSYGFTNYVKEASYDDTKAYVSDDYLRSCVEVDSSGEQYAGSATVAAYYNY